MDLINAISGWLLLLLGLAISIGLHELGHLLPAKIFGVKVTKYMIGFGPTLFSRKRGETEYGIKAIPLGGYIQMVGMIPPEVESTKTSRWRKMVSTMRSVDQIAEEDKDRAFYLLKPWQKLIVMFGGPFANLLIAAVLTMFLFVGFGAYDRTNEIRETISCVPTLENPKCDLVGEPSPSSITGLKQGDKIVRLEGKTITRWSEVEPIIKGKAGQSLNITIDRNGSLIETTIAPKLITDGNGSREYLGVFLETKRFPQTPIEAIGTLGMMLDQTAQMIIQLPVQAVNSVFEIAPGAERDMNGAISIVGLGQFSGTLVSSSELSLEDKVLSQLGLMLSLNVALFVFNMLPLVPLDGGHIAGALYESIKRGIWRLRGKKLEKPVDTAMMMPVAYVVAALLLALTVVLILRDIVNPLQL